MIKDTLEKRIKKIDEAIAKENAVVNQAVANINMLEGGKNECLYWLKELTKEESGETNVSN